MTDPSGGRPESRLRRAVLWRRPDLPTLEHCRLGEAADGWRLSGVVLARAEDVPHEVRYEVVCARDWTTRSVRVELTAGETRRSLELRREDERWYAGSEELTEAAGLVDVDLGFSPSTNTLPIRRLGLAAGEAAALTAAWVRFPDLAVLPLAQRYVRLAERRWRYESRDGEFAAALEVDDLGLVVRYGEWWERIAEWNPGAR